jgi:lysophospholipase L1-like esterase
MLRKNLQRSDVYVFNAAMGSFVSIQERLAYHLAAFPRGAEFVLIVNGANDLIVPASSGVRPGDPSQIGTRYSQFYGNQLMHWLLERSALFNIFFRADLVNSILQHREKLLERDEAFEAYANTIVDLYLENMSAILEDCRANGTTCLVAIQPVRSLSATYVGSDRHDANVLPARRMRQMYEMLFKKLEGHRYAERFVDLTRLVKTEHELDFYTDTVHLDDRGQRLLADALLPTVETAIKAVKRRAARSMIISCEKVLPKEIAVIDLARTSRLNEGEIRSSQDGLRLIADPRRWSYSAVLSIGDQEDLSRPDASIRVQLGASSGEIGIGLATHIGAREFTAERSISVGSEDADIELPIPRGAKRMVLIFRKHSGDGHRSEVDIRRISVQAH